MSDSSDRVVLPEQLSEHDIPYSNGHRRRLEAAGRFPRRIRLSERKHAYLYDELIAWKRARIAARDARPAPAAAVSP